MKYFKYLTLCALVSLLASSCEKKTVDFHWEEVNNKVFFQVYYMSLVKSTAANNISYVTVNGVEYKNLEGSSLIAPYNFVPSGSVGSFYTGDPGVYSIMLETENNGVRDTVYQGMTEVALEAGKQYQIVVYDNTPGVAPHVHEYGTPPIYNEVDSTGNTRFASARLYNYLWDAPGKPTEARLFFDIRRKSNGEIYATYPDDGVGIAFGEATDYFTTILWEDQILATSGYIYVRQDIRAVWPVGSELYPEGHEEILLKNDYWTTYMGRSYHYFYHGDLKGKVRSKKLTRFGAK